MLFWMVLVHYIKEYTEAIYLNDFDKKTMGHNILAFKSTISWIGVGFCLAFYSFHPLYTAPEWINFD